MRKRILSLVLALVMCLSLFPAEVFAEDNSQTAVSAGDVHLEGTNSLGTLLTRSVENMGSGEGNGFPGVITDIQVTGKTATVEYSTDRESELVVAVYPEDGIQLLGTGHAAVTADGRTAEIAIEIDALPEYYVVAAYLLDALSDEPLSEPYISRYYTREFQDFLETDVSDYDPDLVLNLDERADTNFVVFKDGVLTAEAGEVANQVTDNGDGTYTVANPDERFLTLAAGDSFTYTCADGTLLIVVVQSTELRGGSLFITEKPDADLSNVFEYIKIDATSEGMTPIVDTSQMGEGVSLEPSSGTQTYAHEGEASLGQSLTFSMNTTILGTKFTGSVTLAVGVQLKYYLSISWQYFRFKTDLSATTAGEFSGKFKETNIWLAPLICPLLPGVSIVLNPYFVAEAEAAVKVSLTLSMTLGWEYDSHRKEYENGFSNLSSGPKLDWQLSLTGKVFIGLKIDPVISIISTRIANAGAETKIGVEIKAVENWKDSEKVEHSCKGLCFAGTIYGVSNLSAKLQIFDDLVDLKRTLLELKVKIKDFYLRFEDGHLSSGWGTCPNIRYKISLNVMDKNHGGEAGLTPGHPVEGLMITVRKPSDPSFAEQVFWTDTEGKTSFFLYNGDYKLLLQQDGVSKEQNLRVEDQPVSETLVFVGVHGPLYKKGTCEKDLKWSWFENGTLVITGTGAMKDFNALSVAPWYVSLVFVHPSITEVQISEGVTNIGSEAFKLCPKLNTAYIPETVTSIGVSAFSQCPLADVYYSGTKEQWDQVSIGFDNDTLTQATIHYAGSGTCGKNLTWSLLPGGELRISGDGPMEDYDYEHPAPWNEESVVRIVIGSDVTSIGSYAFTNCKSVESVSIPESVKTIGDDAFGSCSALTDIILPDNLESIGNFAFCECDKLERITIPASVKTIGTHAFFFCDKLAIVELSEGLTFIGRHAFSGCPIKTISIPSSVETLDIGAFHNCNQLSQVKMNEGLKTIRERAFGQCRQLTSVSIPSTVSTIGPDAFKTCSRLTRVQLHKSISSIGANAFDGCTDLTDVFFNGTESEWNAISIDFGNDPLLNATIHFNSTGPKANTLPGANALTDEEIITVETPELSGEPEGELVTEPGTVEGPEQAEDPTPATEPEASKEPELFEESSPEETTTPAEEPETTETLGEADAAITSVAAYQPIEDNGSLATFQGLAPGAAYVLLVTADASMPVSLEPENLLYIAQTYADGAGRLSMSYAPRINVSDAVVRVFGASDKNLADAEIEVEQFTDGSFRVTVRYDDVELIEGTDYILILKESENTLTVTVRGRDAYAGEKTVVGDLYPTESVPVTLKLEQSYLLLNVGETAEVKAAVEPAAYAQDLSWTVEDGTCVTVQENGIITALEPGTATVLATVEANGRRYAARCRVDVADEREEKLSEQLHINGVRLTASKLSLELFKTDYARVGVVLNLRQNLTAYSTVIEQTPAADTGVAIESARFSDETVNGLFALRVADDRSLEIVPRNVTLLQGEANPKTIKGSYTSDVLVMVDSVEYAAGKLSFTVKKSLPTIKAKAVKLNSFLSDQQQIIFTGGTVRAAELNPAKTAPDWLLFMENGVRVGYIGPQSAKKSGTLPLLVTVDGWAVMRPVSVSVSASATVPKLSFKPASLMIKPGTNDAASTVVTVSPSAFRNANIHPVTLDSITEGSGKNLKTYSNGTVLNCSFDGEILTVAPGPDLKDGKAHTYKVVLSVDGKQTALTVKTLAVKSAVSLKLKGTGSIDLSIPESPVTITASTGNFNTERADFHIEKIVKAKMTDDVRERFVITQPTANSFRLTAGSGLETGTYTVNITADCGGVSVEKAVNITVKQSSASKVKPAVTLKLSGKLDVIRPDSSVIVTPTIKNWYLYTPAESDLVFYRKVNKKFMEITDPAEIPFAVSVENDRFVVKRIKAINHKTESFAIGLRFDANGTVVCTAKPVVIPLIMGAAKISQSTKKLTLIRGDKYSSGIIHLSPTEEQLRIAENGVTLDAKSAKLFALRDLGDGYCEISYLGRAQTTTKASTVKLSIKLAGNETSIVNTTINVKIKIS